MRVTRRGRGVNARLDTMQGDFISMRERRGFKCKMSSQCKISGAFTETLAGRLLLLPKCLPSVSSYSNAAFTARSNSLASFRSLPATEGCAAVKAPRVDSAATASRRHAASKQAP